MPPASVKKMIDTRKQLVHRKLSNVLKDKLSSQYCYSEYIHGCNLRKLEEADRFFFEADRFKSFCWHY